MLEHSPARAKRKTMVRRCVLMEASTKKLTCRNHSIFLAQPQNVCPDLPKLPLRITSPILTAPTVAKFRPICFAAAEPGEERNPLEEGETFL
jgi:hypothetical protein